MVRTFLSGKSVFLWQFPEKPPDNYAFPAIGKFYQHTAVPASYAFAIILPDCFAKTAAQFFRSLTVAEVTVFKNGIQIEEKSLAG